MTTLNDTYDSMTDEALHALVVSEVTFRSEQAMNAMWHRAKEVRRDFCILALRTHRKATN